MSDADLTSPYAPFVTALREGGFVAPTDGTWTAEQVAAHVVRNNDFWTASARGVKEGGAPPYDNEVAVEAAELSAYVATVGGLDELAALVERSAADLQAAYDDLTPEQRATLVHTTIRHEGAAIVDEPREIGRMLVGNATFHQQMHLDQLLALKG